MNRNRYRLTGCLAGFLLLYAVIFLGGKTDFCSVIASLISEKMVESSLPTYTFLCDIEKNSSFNLVDSILNDIYPMNEFIASEYRQDDLETIESGDEIENPNNNALNNNGNEINNQQVSNNEEILGPREAVVSNEELISSNPSMSVISRVNKSGTVYSREEINNYNFTKSRFFTVTSITSLLPNMLRCQEFLDMNLSMTHDASAPQILIFHTHSQESFTDSTQGDLNTTIVGVGDYLTKILAEKYGYNVIHDRTVYDYVNGRLDRSKAYTYSERGVQKILDENPSIELVIDLHRDGVDENIKFITNIDGKETAKIMLVNGLSYSNEIGNIGYLKNDNRDVNLATSLQLYLLGEAYYPGFMRKNYCNAYRYCLHMRGKSLLVETGANTNSLQEEKNAMEPLADLLDKMLKGEKAY